MGTKQFSIFFELLSRFFDSCMVEGIRGDGSGRRGGDERMCKEVML